MHDTPLLRPARNTILCSPSPGLGAVVIVDELGPVELRGQGHMPAVRKALAVPDLQCAVLVVWRALVPSLLAELDASDAVVVDIETEGQESADSILSALEI